MKEVLERGDLQFFWTPSVQPAGADEHVLRVQSLFAILSPEAGGHRRLRIGRKRMPASSRDRFWARIERVGSLQRVLGDKLEPEQYMTKTRGERVQPGARPLAQGAYALLHHDDHVHFTYEVEPFSFEDAPEGLSIAERGDHLMLFKARDHARAVWSPSGEVRALDREGTEIVLVGERSGTENSSWPPPPNP